MKKVLEKKWLFYLYISLFGLFFARVWSIALFLDDIGLRSGWIASWADGAAHLTYMSAFAYRNVFPTEHPIFLGKSFSYPFVADMIGGYLVKLGLPLHVSYNLLGFLFSMFLVVMVWKLFEELFKDKWISLMGGLVFFLGAGLTGLEKLVGQPLKSIFDTYDWVDIISAQIMPQRALILGMPLGILIFLIVYEFFKNKKTKKWRLLFGGILTGFLSVVHTHSLIGIFFLISGLFIQDVVKNKKIRNGWWWYGLPAISVGVCLLLKQVGSFDGSFFRWLPFWLSGVKGENLIWFWIKSWGIWPIVAFFGFRQIKKKQRYLFLPLIFLFVLLNMFSFQPYDWDNTKLFLWIYLFFSGLVGVALKSLWKKSKVVVVVLMVLMTFSGILDAKKLLQPQDDPVLYLFTNQDLKLAEKIIEISESNDVFLTSSYHLNFIPALTGRQILMGYPGWLWTYGIEYDQREDEVEMMFSGKKGKELIDKYNVSYVVFDYVVKKSIKDVDEEYFEENFSLVAENNRYRVFKIKD